MTTEELDRIFNKTTESSMGITSGGNNRLNVFFGNSSPMDSRRNITPPPQMSPQYSGVSYGYGYGDTSYNAQGMTSNFGGRINAVPGGYPGISHPSWGMIGNGGGY